MQMQDAEQYTPTPDEIAARAAEIRRSWSQDEHIKRGSMNLYRQEMNREQSQQIIDAARAAVAARDEMQQG